MTDHTPPADLDALLRAVCDEQSFVKFIDALSIDFERDREIIESFPPNEYRYSAGPLGWENGTVDNFLGAAVRWASSGVFRDFSADNPWRRCAHILYAGKFYE